MSSPAGQTSPRRRVMAIAAAVLATLAAGLVPAGAGASTSAPDTDTNPWLERRFLNIAHAGGEVEAPEGTVYAYRRATALGADMIELDVHSTADDRLVVIHDATVDRTTNGTGRIRDLTFRQVHALDAAHNFVPGQGPVAGLPPESYPLRGIRTHDQRAPWGYRASDFAIPSLRQVLRTFRHVPINIEIKGTSDEDTASFLHNAQLLAELLNRTGRTDVIVTSFNDQALATFHQLAPQISLAPGRDGLINYFLTGAPPIEGTVAVQVPVQLAGIPVATAEFIARAHADGFAVHVWFSGTAPEDEPTYLGLINACADGLMVARPKFIERLLNEHHIARPGTPGVDPCR